MSITLDDIKKSTDFEVLSDGNTRTFTNRPMISTPLKLLDVLNGGGFPIGCIVDLFGPPAAGKSSFGYEMLGEFQKQYPEGLAIVIDSESSVESKRMRALGVDPEKLLILRGATMEAGYKQILSVLYKVKLEKPKNRVPVFILWDSLSNTTTDAQYEKENVNGGGLAEAARINKEYLKQVNMYLDDVDAIIVLINQVSSKIGMFVGSGYNEAGGNALKHNIQYRLEFSANKLSYEDGIASRGESGVKVTKNKLGPTTLEYPISLDIRKGGVIDQVRSVLNYLYVYFIEKTGRGRYYFIPKFYKEYPKFHQYLSLNYPKFLGNFLWEDFISVVNDDRDAGGIFFDFFLLKWADIISTSYTLQASVVAPYRQTLIDRIDQYAKDHNWDENYQLPEFSEENEEE